MVVSLVHPHTCGFSKAAIWRITRDASVKIKRVNNETPYQHRVRTVQFIHERFCQSFPSKKFAIDFKTFMRKLPDLHKKFSNWNPRKKTEREQYFEAFSADNWKALPNENKAKHSLTDCRACFHKYSVQQSFFLVQSKQFQGCLKQNPAIVAKNIAAKISQQTGQVKCTRRDYQTGVQKVYDEINPAFERVFHVPFEKALTTLPTLNIQMSKSTTEKKRERRKVLRKAKTSIEEHWKSTSVMRYACKLVYSIIINFIVTDYDERNIRVYIVHNIILLESLKNNKLHD